MSEITAYSRLAREYAQRGLVWFRERSLITQMGLLLGCVAVLVAEIVFLRHYNEFIKMLVSLSDSWRELRGGSLIMFAMVFCVSFPPLVGYSAMATLTGMIWGCPAGFPVLASATVLGSLCSFLLFRNVLHERALHLVDQNKTIKSIVLVLNGRNSRESLFILTLVRICPLPYSFSNGALAAAPGLSAAVFTGASVISSPKLLIHLFIGSSFKHMNEDKSTTEKLVDLLSIFITGCAFVVTTHYIYVRMKEHLQELNNEEQDDSDSLGMESL